MAKKAGKQKAPPPRQVIARNRRASYEFHLIQTVEAGLVLKGCEVRSLRENGATITQAFGRVERGEAWIVGMEIPILKSAVATTHRPSARRKLLLHRAQIKKLEAQLQTPGRTLVPVEIYFNEKGLAKVEIAVAAGKKSHDKRQAMAKRDADREIRRRVR